MTTTTTTAVKIAAIFARQSRGEQSASFATQINDARAMLEADGYTVPEEFIFRDTWHSLSILDSPKMQALLSLVRHGKIQGVGMHHGDRLAGNPAQKAIILDLCEKHGVKLLAKYAPIQEGPEGELVEYVRTWGKEQSVLRAQQASRDGLRDRVVLKGLPVGGVPPYGYKYEYQQVNDKERIPVRIIPNPDTFAVACKIWKLALAGTPLRSICAMLYNDGIPTARGKARWQCSTIRQILTNTTYSGEVYGLKRMLVEPKARRKKTFGKTTSVARDKELWQRLNLEVTEPIVTLSQYQEVQRQLQANKKLSPRRSGRVYLLSGMIFCPFHNHCMNVSLQRNHFYYRCRHRIDINLGSGGCATKPVNGGYADATVWARVCDFLKNPRVFMAEMDRRRNKATGSAAEVQDYIKSLERKKAKVDEMETELVGLKLRREVSEEAYQRQSALLRAERTHYADEIGRQKAVLDALDEKEKAVDALTEARNRIVHKLDSATPEDRRWVLRMLDTRVLWKDGVLEISVGVPLEQAANSGADSVHNSEVMCTESAYRFSFDAPLRETVEV